MVITCLLPAAGASSRMRGGDKLLEDVDGTACLATLAERALQAGLEVIVTLPSADHPRAAAIAALPVTTIIVKDAATLGMSASLKQGAQAMDTSSQGLMILPADMPAITSLDMKRMTEQFEQLNPLILRARAKSGQLGHPIIFSAKLRHDFAALTGDKGAQTIVKKYKNDMAFLDFEDERPTLDLDTPEAWAVWRRSL